MGPTNLLPHDMLAKEETQHTHTEKKTDKYSKIQVSDNFKKHNIEMDKNLQNSIMDCIGAVRSYKEGINPHP